jgi:uncharacterized protein YndB with AHSA1/START domain
VAQISAVIHIDAAPQEVWDAATDLDRMGRWVSIHHGFPEPPPGHLRTGSRFTQTLKVAGTKFRVEWTATEVDGPGRLSWDGAGPSGTSAHTSYTLETEGDGTRFTYVNEFSLPAGKIGKAAARVVARQAKKQADVSLETLKRLVEA